MRMSRSAALLAAAAVLASVTTAVGAPAAQASVAPRTGSTPQPEAVYTPTTVTEPIADGKFRTTSYTGLAFRKDQDGQWSRTAADVVETADAEQPLSAPKSYKPIKFGSDPASMVELDWDGAPLVLSAQGFAKVKPVKDPKDGKKVSYKEVDRDVDVDYEVGTGGVKELITLRSSKARRSFTFHLSDPRGRLGDVRPTGDGAFEFTNTDNEGMRLALPPAIAYELPAEGALPDLRSGSATQTVVRAGDGFDITLAVDEDWLVGKSFPIVLDPTLQINSPAGAGDCWLEGGTSANVSMCSQSLVAGANAGRTGRTVIRFDLPGVDGTGAYVNTVQFNVMQSGIVNPCLGTTNTTCNQTVALRAVSAGSRQGWNFVNSATWLRYRTDVGTDPATGLAPTWANVGVADGGGPDCCSDIATFSVPYNQTGRVLRSFSTANFPALRDLVQGWANSAQSNHGFHLRGYTGTATQYVKFDNRQQTTPASISVTYTPKATAPTNVSAAPRDRALGVTWTDPANAADAQVSKYRVHTYQNGTEVLPYTECTTSFNCVVSSLTNGLDYTVQVQGISSFGDGALSAPTPIATPFGRPRAVTDPSASAPTTADGSGRVTVSWTSVPGKTGTGNGRDIANFTVRPRAADGAARTDQPDRTCTVVPCTIGGLTNGQAYDFVIWANTIAEAGPGETATTPGTVTPYGVPDQPLGVTASVTEAPGQAVVRWTAFSPNNTGTGARDNGRPIEKFVVKAYLAGTGTVAATATCDGPTNVTACTVPNLSNGTSYQFTVTARNPRGDGPESAKTAAAVPYDAPTGPTGVTATDTRAAATADVSWTQGPGNGRTVTSWLVTPYAMPGRAARPDQRCYSTTCPITGLDNGQAYVFTVRADTGETVRGTSAHSADSNQVVPYGTPGKPTGVTVGVDAAQEEAYVEWTAPADGGRPIIDYTVTAKPSNGAASTTKTCTASGCTVTGLKNNVSYDFTATARNARGTGPASDPPVTATPYGLPGTPSPPTADPSPSPASLRVTWTEPSGNGDPSPMSYLVRAYPAAQPAATRTEAARKTCTGTTCDLSPLANGTAYVITVTAVNRRGTGAESADSAPQTPYGVPAAPASATATPGDKTVKVAWPAADDNGRPVTGYEIRLFDAAAGTQIGDPTPAGADARSVTLAAANGTDVYATVTATNLRGTSEPARTDTVRPLEPVGIAKAVTAPPGGAAPGDLLQYTITLTNPNPTEVKDVKVTDRLPTGTTLVQRPLYEGFCKAAAAVCGVTAGELTIDKLAIGPGAEIAIPVAVQTGPGLRTCHIVKNTAAVVDTLGSRPSNSADALGCDAGLGLEPWWTTETTPVGPQSTLSVNVANGNAVVQGVDSTAVQAHGRLAYGLRRTYNSQARTDVTLPGSLGAGWSFNFGETDDTGLGTNGSALTVPTLAGAADNVLNPLAVTLVDRDGTRHQFKPRAAIAAFAVGSLSGAQGALRPAALAAPGLRICVDVAYDAPKGVHLGLWRYVALEAQGSDCPSEITEADDPVVLGYAAIRPDRLRTEYDAQGRLVSMRDANGVEMRHLYGADPQRADFGRLTAVFEPRSCRKADGGTPGTAADLAPTCRAFTFDYANSAAAESPHVLVTDPAHRKTRYELDRALTGDPTQPVARLVKVVDPDGGSTAYAYGGCGGTADQLCTITDRRQSVTRLAYQQPATLGGPPAVRQVTDRRGSVTTYEYDATQTKVTTPNNSNGTPAEKKTPGQASIYSQIDDDGRVGRADDYTHNPDGEPIERLRRTTYSWDTGCRRPTDTADNNLCAVTREAAGTDPAGQAVADETADERTEYLYSEEGATLRERRVLAGGDALDTTWGHAHQYVSSSGPGAVAQDTPSGNGEVATAPRPSNDRLFVISDKTRMVTPNGNAAGADFGAHTTLWEVDNDPAAAVSAVPPTGGTCLPSASSPNSTPADTANTGNVCETRAPGSAPGGNPSVTRSTYDSFGQRTSSTTANAIAATAPDKAPPATRYVYFDDNALDVSGTVSAGGWLRHVVDVTSPTADPGETGYDPVKDRYVAFDYDAAGNTVRTWDRDATAGLSRAAFPGPVGSARSSTTPAPRAAQTFYLPAGDGSRFAEPWRYAVETIDPVGNRTTLDIDRNGNVERLTPPRGHAAGNADHDTVSRYDAGDLLLETTKAGTTVRYDYDAFGNKTSARGPHDTGEADRRVTVWQYDAANRNVATLVSRGTPATGGQCRPAGEDDAPLPAGRTVCTTTVAYDHVDNPVRSADANGTTTRYTYDAAHRPVAKRVPRGHNGVIETVTRVNYDADGNPVDVCAPREFTDGSNACTAASRHAVHTKYDPAGRPTARTTYRTDDSAPLVSRVEYDPDGNTTSSIDARGTDDVAVRSSYDLQGRRTHTDTPRAGRTSYLYTPSGDVLAVAAPGSNSNGNADNPGGHALRITGHAYDANHRPVETVTALQVPEFTEEQVRTAVASNLTDSLAQTDLRTRTEYDPDGNVTAQYAPRAFVGPDGNGTPVLLDEPDARHRTTIRYDLLGRPTDTYAPRADSAGSGPLDDPTGDSNQSDQCRTGAPGYPAGVLVCRTARDYDAQGNLTQVLLPTRTSDGDTSRKIEYKYTDDNLLETVTAPSPTGTGTVDVLVNTYDAAGRVRATKNAAGHTTEQDYTPDGLVTAVRGPTGPNGLDHVVETDYDANGQPVAVRTPRTLYDTAGQPTGTQTPVTETRYFNDGLVESVTAGRTAEPGDQTVDLTTRYAYDNAGNPTEVHSPEAVARVSSEINPAGAPTKYEHTPDNLLAAVVQPVAVTSAGATESRRTRYAYDPAGRKTSAAVEILDAAGNASGTSSQTFAYYPTGLLRTENGRNSSGQIRHQYDADGNRTSAADTTTDTTVTGSYYLDGLPRDVTSSARRTAYAYDGAGSLAARQEGPTAGDTGTTRFQFNDAGLPTQITEPDTGATTTRAYDQMGRLKTETRPNGTSQAWAYRSDDLLGSTTVTAGSTQLARWNYEYDELGRIRTQDHASTGADPAERAGTARGSGTAGPEGATASSPYRVTYDAAGRLATFTDPDGTRTLEYDRNNNRRTYGKPNEPRPSRYTYRADDSILSSFETTALGETEKKYDYEPWGGLRADQCNKYAYDPFDRLKEVEKATPTATCGSPKVTYGYDAIDRQVRRTEAIAPSTNETTSISYDGWDDTVVRESFTGGASEGALAYALDQAGRHLTARHTNKAGTTSNEFLHEDGTGSTGLVSGENASVKCAARYDAYGSPGGNTAATSPPPGQCSSGKTVQDVFYRGERKDTATGQYQLGSRTYDPTKASFLTPDTFRTGGSAANTGLGVDPLTRNSYAYVNGDPVNFTDPSGHMTLFAGLGAGYCGGSCQQWTAERGAAANARPKPAKAKHGWGFNALMGFGKGAWASGPGAIGDLLGLIPTDATRALDRKTDEWQLGLQEWSGADIDSRAFRYVNVGTQVGGAVIGGVGLVRAGATGVAKGAKAIQAMRTNGARATAASVADSVRKTATGIKTRASQSKTANAARNTAKAAQARLPRLADDTGSISFSARAGSTAANKGPAAANYRGRLNADLASQGLPRLPKDWDAHHRIPQLYRDHPDLKGLDFDAPSNLRGVPGNRAGNGAGNVHNQITQDWNDFASRNPNASGTDIGEFASRIDAAYEGFWWR